MSLEFGKFVLRAGQRVTFPNGNAFVVGLAPDYSTHFDQVTGLPIPIDGENRITVSMIANYTERKADILELVKKDASKFIAYLKNQAEVNGLKIVLNFDKSMLDNYPGKYEFSKWLLEHEFEIRFMPYEEFRFMNDNLAYTQYTGLKRLVDQMSEADKKGKKASRLRREMKESVEDAFNFQICFDFKRETHFVQKRRKIVHDTPDETPFKQNMKHRKIVHDTPDADDEN